MLGSRCLLGLAVFGLSGCVRTLDITDTDAPFDPTDTASTDTDSPTTGPVCLPGATTNYALPSARWGLAALYAQRRLRDDPRSELNLDARWFLASGWQATGFGCADYGNPWTPDSEASGDIGCLKLPESTVWIELCRLYPSQFPCDAYSGTFAGDTPEVSTIGLAWYLVAAHAMLTRFADPNAFYADATDPLARERLSALLHHGGAWNSDLATILSTCGDDVAACVSTEYNARHVLGVSEKLTTLAAADCYEGQLTSQDLENYSAEMATLWPDEDWSAATAAAVQALGNGDFATNANAVLDAYDENLTIRLACPEEELWDTYRFSCP